MASVARKGSPNRRSSDEKTYQTMNRARWGRRFAQPLRNVAVPRRHLLRIIVLATLAIVLAGGASGARYPVDEALPPTSGTPADRVPELVFDGAKTIQDVPKWLVIGPFKQSSNQTVDRWWDYLAQYVGKSENAITIAELEGLAKQLGTTSREKPDALLAVQAGGPTNQIYFSDALGLPDKPAAGEERVAYAFCQIVCPRPYDAALFTRGDGRIRIWLNGEELLSHDTPGDEYAEKFREVSVIHLHKGSNLLVAHVAYDSEACGFWAALKSAIPVAIQQVADAPDQTIGNAWYLRAGSSIAVDVPVYGVKRPTVTFLWHGQAEGRAKAGELLAIPAGWKGAGVGYLNTEICGVTFSQPVFVGDPATAVKRYQEDYTSVENKPGGEHLYAALFRCEHLVEPEYLKPEDPDWQRKFATQAAVFEEGAEELRRGVNPFRGRVGKYFRTYRSAIDGSIQYCLVYVPRHASRVGGKLPVVLETPAVLQNVRPFLSSLYAAHGADWAAFRMAEQFGCIVVLPDGRSNAYGNPIGLADMREAVSSLAGDLPVDLNRVSIQGWCSGGLYALMLATFYPDDYTGVVVSYPVTMRDKNMYPAGSERLPFPVAKDWIAANNPFHFSANLDGVPLLMVHHDVEEGHYNEPAFALQTPRYAVGMKRTGLPVTVRCFHRPGYYRGDEMELTFQWCLAARKMPQQQKAVIVAAQTKYGEGHGIRLEEQDHSLAMSRIEATVANPQRLELVTWNVRQVAIDLKRFGFVDNASATLTMDGRVVKGESLVDGWIRLRTNAEPANQFGKSAGLEGPLSHMLARPFIVSVEGGNGDAAHAPQRWCEQFRNRWRADFFCDCRFKPLEALTREDWRNSDVLVFSGDPERALPGAGARDRLSIAQDGITVGRSKFKGAAVGVLAVWRNPQWPDHYIAIATGNDINRCDLPDVNFAFEGWFDYLVWQNVDAKKTQVLAADRFDRDWR